MNERRYASGEVPQVKDVVEYIAITGRPFTHGDVTRVVRLDSMGDPITELDDNHRACTPLTEAATLLRRTPKSTHGTSSATGLAIRFVGAVAWSSCARHGSCEWSTKTANWCNTSAFGMLRGFGLGESFPMEIDAMIDEQPHDYCMKCDRLQPVRHAHFHSGILWHCTVCGHLTDFEYLDEWDCPDDPEENGSDDNDD